jgi:hypothetical protein
MSDEQAFAWAYIAFMVVWLNASVVAYFRNRRSLFRGALVAMSDGFRFTILTTVLVFLGFLFIRAIVTVIG